ncbi:MAG: dihydroorotate dehydrogenase electron transfer subunit [Firmicutes bacterium]|nr:dihydroorotate dehydrogenase electron transfer subunit [Bacillota bacterium]
MLLEKAVVLSNKQIRPDYWQLGLYAPQIAAQAQPGQFMMVTAADSFDPFLKRPMGINIIDPKSGFIRIIYLVLGRGTKLLTNLRENMEIDLLGPLGNCWKIEKDCRRALIMGGGSGVATLLPLARELFYRRVQVDVILGARSKDYLSCADEFAGYGSVIYATIDGSAGYKGLATDIFPGDIRYDMVYACGPMKMMENVVHLSREHHIRCQVSLEENMGCGYGVCMGCICSVRQADGQIVYKRICKDGPVFYGEEVFW